MHLRSGLKVGDSKANQVVEVDTSADMQEEISSTQAERGTSHLSSFSTTDRAFGSPAPGESGPSTSYDQEFHRGLQHPHQDNPGEADFDLYGSPADNQHDEEEPSQDHIHHHNIRSTYRPIAPRPAPTPPQNPLPYQEESPFSPSYPSQSYPTPSLFQPQTPLPPLMNGAYQTPSTSSTINTGMIPFWWATGPWSPGTQTPENRKRALSEQHDLAGYPKDRDYPDKMETALANLAKGKGTEGEEEEVEGKPKKKKKPRRSQRGAERSKKARRDPKEDQENGGGSASFASMA